MSVLLLAISCSANTVAFDAKLHRHKSAGNRVLVDKVGVLAFDDDRRGLSFKDNAHDKFEIPYGSVIKAVFEVTTHMRGGTASQVLKVAGLPGVIAGTAIARGHIVIGSQDGRLFCFG